VAVALDLVEAVRDSLRGLERDVEWTARR